MDKPSNAPEQLAQREAPPHGDAFNRKELYSQPDGRNVAKVGQVAEKPGVNADAHGTGHQIDFAAAGDIYAAKGVNTMNGMLGGARVERVGLSGASKDSQDGVGSDGLQKPGGKAADKVDKYDDTDGSGKGVPKDGVIRPEQKNTESLRDKELTPYDMMRQRDRQGARDENGNFSEDSPNSPSEKPGQDKSAADKAGKLGDRVLSSETYGKPNEVSSFDSKNNTLTQYSFGADGHVDGRTVTDLNKNTVDSIKYDENSMPVSHKQSTDGKPAEDKPIDEKTPRVFNTLNADGSLNTIEENAPGSRTKFSFDGNNHAVGKDVEKYNADGSSTQEHQELDIYGKPSVAKTNTLDKEGKLSETVTESPYSTTIDKYGAAGKVVESAVHSEGRDSLTRFTDKGSATATRADDGTREIDIQNNDGSRQKFMSNSQLHMSGSYERKPDGSTHQITNDANGHTETVVDGKSGVWARSNQNKAGLIEKSWGRGSEIYESFPERGL